VDVPYQNAIYGAKKDAEISYMTTQVIHNGLKDLSSFLQDKSPQMEILEPKQELLSEPPTDFMEFIEIN
jgi:hypothetical protein